MRERRVHEAAVAPAGAERDPLALEQHDVAPLLAGEQGGPEAGQAAADHEQIGLLVGVQRRAGVRRAGLREPVGRGSAWARDLTSMAERTMTDAPSVCAEGWSTGGAHMTPFATITRVPLM